MKHLTEKFNESYNITLGQVSTINEAWGSTKHYKSELEKIFTDYEKKKAPKKSSRPMGGRGKTAPEEVLAKYPMQILQLESADAFLKEVEQVLNNMKSTFDTFSRAGSILALQVQLGEYKGNKNFDNFESDAEEIEKEPIKELSW